MVELKTLTGDRDGPSARRLCGLLSNDNGNDSERGVAILGLLLLAASNDNGSSSASAPRSTVVPLNAQAWSILYSPGMPPHPKPHVGGGWYFDFPTAPNSFHYVLATVNIAAASYVETRISVTTTETAVFVYNLQPDYTCAYPAHVRFLLQEKGDDLSGANGKQYFRWWRTAQRTN